MKRPSVAFALSFILPGAGLAYLGYWSWAFLNLGCVIVLGIVCNFVLPEDVFMRHAHTIAIALGSLSGGLAYGITLQVQRTKTTC